MKSQEEETEAPDSASEGTMDEEGINMTYTSDFSCDMSLDFVVNEDSETLPERKLLAAVLSRALIDVINDDRLFLEEDLVAWITDENRDDLTSFLGLCEALGLDAGNIRTKTLELRAKGAGMRHNGERMGYGERYPGGSADGTTASPSKSGALRSNPGHDPLGRFKRLSVAI